ncbi:hypothetical protein [uncultured Litoreibacter sp.]|uniref:hypothetical protein n=1 Tax=uncultured Litoreibacter sp. TaxID=1392394 RepID=UPI00261B462A|nr:hypothetical protein [uncultured Litoreibacter sp.]
MKEIMLEELCGCEIRDCNNFRKALRFNNNLTRIDFSQINAVKGNLRDIAVRKAISARRVWMREAGEMTTALFT